MAALADPPVDVEQLAADRILYVRACGGCHALPAVEAFTAEQWPRIIEDMGRDDANLDADERGRVLRYLLSANRSLGGEGG
jgi:hypothetical protein